MKIPTAFLLAASLSIAGAQTPADVPGLQLWLDATDPATITADGGGLVSQWDDKSGLGNHATQTDPARQPTVGVGAIVGSDAIHLDAVGAGDPGNDGMIIDAFSLARPYSVVMVDQIWGTVGGRTLQSSTGANWLTGRWNGNPRYYAGGWVGPAGGAVTAPNPVSITEAGGSSTTNLFSIDGNLAGINNANFTSPGGLGLSSSGTFDEPSQADIGEIIIVDRLLTDGDRDTLAAHLAANWGFPRYSNANATRTVTFTGADPGEGLDFSGTFLTAVNVGEGVPVGQVIGDATFVNDAGMVTAENQIPTWFASAFAVDTPEDTSLNEIMASIRWTNSGDGGTDDIAITVPGLTVGNSYKVQMMFADAASNRHFRVLINGELRTGDLQMAAHTGNSTDKGVALVHEFIARSETLDIVFDAINLTNGDLNPTIQAFTVEDTGPTFAAGVEIAFANAADLDFAGTFTHAVDIQGVGGQVIGDATFTNDTASGVTVFAENQIADGGWVAPDYGATAADDALESITRSIRWTGTTGSAEALRVDLAGLTPGENYKLQLIFDEQTSANRGFDISLEGVLILDNAGTSLAFGVAGGAAVFITFVAPDDTLNIALEGFPTAATDLNPLLCGLTLEETTEVIDTDSDGLVDLWEIEHFGDLDEDGAGDNLLDMDGLNNAQEFANGTDPNDDDSDDDDLLDGEEVNTTLTNPTLADTDGDTLEDGDEVNTHLTNPLAADTDFDLLSDGAEINTHSTDPLLLDPDGDGYSDAIEVAALTNPNDGGSFPIDTTAVGNFAGGDLTDGLDLEGDIVYAVNFSSDGAAGAVRDATFTDSAAAGVTIAAQHDAPGWGAAVTDTGASANDDVVDTVLSGIRWSGLDNVGDDSVDVTLGNLIPGTRYKLQLLFNEACCANRGFDVLIEGALAVDEFNPSIAEGGLIRQTAAVIIHDFIAGDDTLEISLQGAGVTTPEFNDRNAIINGLTLEKLTPAAPFEITGVALGIDGVAITFNSVPGINYAIDYTTSLQDDQWEEIEDSPVETGVTVGNSTTWTDANPGRLANPLGIYRVREF